MGTAILIPPNVCLHTVGFKSLACRDGPAACSIPSGQSLCDRTPHVCLVSTLHSLGRRSVIFPRFRSHYSDSKSIGSSGIDPDTVILGGQREFPSSEIGQRGEIGNSAARPQKFTNRFLNFVRLQSLINGAAESFFKSEIRRRLFVTAVLILISRVGYFIPLPGFDRRLIPEDYLSFAYGSVDELGDFSAELKLSLFQLGISPQIAASILMQLCSIIPKCTRKEDTTKSTK